MKIRRLIDTGEWTTRRYLSLLGTLLIWVIVAIDGWYLWPTQLGGDTSIVVVSGKSMEPTFFGGDLVIARKMAPSIGDVIVYAPEGLGGSQIVHRIIGGTADEGWQMQGDNNDFIDPFNPKGAEVKGVVLVHYSNFGRVTVLLLNPMVWAFVLLAAMVLMLWYTGDNCDERDDDDGESQDRGEDDGDPEAEAEEELDLIDRVVEGTEAAVARMVAAGADVGAAALAALTRPTASPRHAAPSPRHAAPVLRYAAPAYLRGFAIIAVLGLLAVFGPSVASASQLIVNAGEQPFFTTVEKCDTLNLTATTAGTSTNGNGSGNGKKYDHVSITGVTADPDCAGKPITVSVYTKNGNPTETASDISVVGAQEFEVQEYLEQHVELVVVKIDGWLFLATWTVPSDVPTDPAVGTCQGYLMTTGQIPSGTQCVLTTSTGGLETLPVGNGGPGYFRRINLTTNFSPSGYSENNSYVGEYAALTLWRVTLNLTAPAYGTGIDFAGGYYVYNMNNAAMAAGEDCSDPTSVTFQERTASSGQGADIVVSDAPIGYWSYALMCSSP